jgi:hypothetical protein
MQFTGHESNFPVRPHVFRQARMLINFWQYLVILLLYIASSVGINLLPLQFVSTMSEIWSNFETHNSFYLYPVAVWLDKVHTQHMYVLLQNTLLVMASGYTRLHLRT